MKQAEKTLAKYEKQLNRALQKIEELENKGMHCCSVKPLKLF